MELRNWVEWKSDSYGIKETTSIETGRRSADVEWACPTPVWIKIQEGYLGSEKSQIHIRPPSPGFWCQEEKSPQLLAAKTNGICNRVQPRGGAQIGICNGVQNSGCSGNIREKCIYDVLIPTSLSWGKGHMEQGHWELFCTATPLWLTSGMVI